MAQKANAVTDGSGDNHPTADLETIVIGPDDVVEMMRRNWRDETENRSHCLRVTPPLEGERKAKLHVSEDYTYYPADMIQKPIHVGANALLAGHTDKPVPNHLRHPDMFESKGLFREHYDCYGPGGDNRELTDEEEAEWDEWWENELELWECDLRNALKEEFEWPARVDTEGNWETVTIKVRYEESD